MGDRWGPAGPPDDAYSRVTDPLRYALLHPIARDLLDDLQRRFDVAAHTSSEVDPHGTTPAPVTTLVPSNPESSPLAVKFSAFPGLTVSFGRSHRVPIPSCGCDACDDTVDECAQELHDITDAVTAGSFGERIVRADHRLWHESWRSNESGTTSANSRLTRKTARALRKELGSDDARWAPWPARADR